MQAMPTGGVSHAAYFEEGAGLGGATSALDAAGGATGGAVWVGVAVDPATAEDLGLGAAGPGDGALHDSCIAASPRTVKSRVDWIMGDRAATYRKPARQPIPLTVCRHLGPPGQPGEQCR